MARADVDDSGASCSQRPAGKRVRSRCPVVRPPAGVPEPAPARHEVVTLSGTWEDSVTILLSRVPGARRPAGSRDPPSYNGGPTRPSLRARKRALPPLGSSLSARFGRRLQRRRLLTAGIPRPRRSAGGAGLLRRLLRAAALAGP